MLYYFPRLLWIKDLFGLFFSKSETADYYVCILLVVQMDFQTVNFTSANLRGANLEAANLKVN